MFAPLEICIGLRYTRARRRTRFISFISMTSMLGIALGVRIPFAYTDDQHTVAIELLHGETRMIGFESLQARFTKREN